MKSNIQRRREIRAIEAKRDKLIERIQKDRDQLATVRAQLKQARKK